MSGKLWLIGLGPGERSLLTPQAVEAIRRAEVLVGYKGYFEWIADLTKEKEIIALSLGDEVERARLAVQKAREGRAVGVISSGDAGIYGMASVVLEYLSDANEEDCPEIAIIPGVSAINASAALLGAPLGHDFAVISLSDLLTPWERIEKRIRAAADADFVVAILNPKSPKRDWQLRRACDILLTSRSVETPVGIVRNAFRPGQAVRVTTLAELAGCEVDMFTTIIVGCSQTRAFRSMLVTPRGYEFHPSKKHEAAAE